MRRLLLTACLLLLVGGCIHPTPQARALRPVSHVSSPSVIRFTRTTTEAGLRFVHRDGSSGRYYLPEVMGPGCAFVDLTGDELPDLYLLNGAALPGAPPGLVYGSRLYRNNGDGTFADVTQGSGLEDGKYALGCCAGDYDNDGDTDLFVTHFGESTLYRNTGKGSFSDATQEAGIRVRGFCTGASFADYDGDGYLDLYVCRYVKWTPETNRRCAQMAGEQSVQGNCKPTVYPAERGVLYHNNGDGTFTDQTTKAGMTLVERSLGCVWSDIDDDGDPDLYIANDLGPNYLYINRGGRFREEAMVRGVALGETGQPLAGMGVCAADYDGDGHLDLACTNFLGEYLNVYRNRGDGYFEEMSAQAGVMEPTSRYVGFGLGMPDLDLDGALDMVVVNGHVSDTADQFIPGVSIKQPSLCFRGEGKGSFVLISEPGGELTTPRFSRGLAFADYDADGDVDALVANRNGEPDLARNDSSPRGNWLQLDLRGVRCNRSAIGARVVVTAGGRSWTQEVCSGSSYLSQSDLVLTFGLGENRTAEKVSVRWPGGGTQEWSNLAAGKRHVNKEKPALP